MNTFIANVLETITLNTIHQMPDGEYTEALTDNYLKLRLRGRYEPNQKIMAHIDGVKDGALLGTAFGTRQHGHPLQAESIPSSVLS
jgi:hypothetical protein